jgi:hypothetical protein
LLAALCLMRHDDWTLREGEVRLPCAPQADRGVGEDSAAKVA